MKKILLGVSAILLMLTNANANIYTFNYGGVTWGTMTVEQYNSNTLSVRYDASDSSIIPSGTQATGFGFAPDLGTFVVSNPTDPTFTWDLNAIDWVQLTNLNVLPTTTNTGLPKSNFQFAASSGSHQNLNPPGIGPGQSDIFYLDFNTNISLSDLTLVAVRLQGLPDSGSLGYGSLFLSGDPTIPVPEPATMLLFGTGLASLAGFARRKRS